MNETSIIIIATSSFALYLYIRLSFPSPKNVSRLEIDFKKSWELEQIRENNRHFFEYVQKHCLPAPGMELEVLPTQIEVKTITSSYSDWIIKSLTSFNRFIIRFSKYLVIYIGKILLRYLSSRKSQGAKIYINKHGYKCFSNSGKLVHRYIAQKMIGRRLQPGEEVHHIDGNKLNNSRSNLHVCSSHFEHEQIHYRNLAIYDQWNAPAIYS